MSDTVTEIKGKPKNKASDEVIPETDTAQTDALSAQSSSIAGFGQIDAKAMKAHFAQGIYMELLRARADHGFFNLATMPRQTGQKMLVDELVHLRGVAEVAAEVWFKNK